MAENTTEVLQRQGHRPLDPELAVTALNRAPGPNTVVTDTDWSTFHPTITAQRPMRMLDEFAPQQEEPTGRPDWLDRLDGLPQTERVRTVRDLVRSEVADVLAHPHPPALDADRAFRDLGLDSMTAVELRNRLTAHTGLSLPPALIFDHPTVNELVELVDERMRESDVDAATGTAEFERIGALVRDSHDGKTRSALRDRLTALIDEIDHLSTQDDEKPPNAKEVLDDADDDALFAFINNELNN